MTDRSSDTRRFDPRFDPAFQPGYDPRNDPSASARTVPGRPATVRPSASAVVSPPARSTWREGTGPEQRDDPGARQEDDLDSAEVEGDDELAMTAATQRTGINPFVLTLWVISVVTIITGVGILRWVPVVSSDLSSSADSQYDFYFLQALVIGAPIFIALGMASAIGILFLYAVRWSKRPGAAG